MQTKDFATCHIVGAGDFHPRLLKKEAGDFIIAADGGYLHLKDAEIGCDLYVGDSDSLGFEPKDVEVLTLPQVKDDTDTLAAVKAGLERGYRRFCLYGALGGKRFSHSVANLSTLLFLDSVGAEGMILDQNGCITLLTKGAYRLPFPCRYFSLFAEKKASLSISGAKYNLEKATLYADFPLGVSNEGGEDTKIQIFSGKVFLILDF